MGNEKKENINKYPDMVMVPTDSFFCYQLYKCTKVCYFNTFLSLLIVGIAIYERIVLKSLEDIFILCGMSLLVIILLANFHIARRIKKLNFALLRVRQFASHIEFSKHRCRGLRRVYKDGKLGLMSDDSYELEIPIEFHEISWLFGGTYLTLAEPNATPIKYEEGIGF